VQAFSRGGWSMPSLPSEIVCPGDSFQPIDFFTRWTRLAAGGSLAVADRLNAYPFIREDAVRGLQILLSIGQKENGFYKGIIQIKVAEVAIKIMKIYMNDPDIIPTGLKLYGYALRGPHSSDVERIFIEASFAKTCLTYSNIFRKNTAVANALVFLQSCLPYDINIIHSFSDDALLVE
jgi:hypothetical protein